MKIKSIYNTCLKEIGGKDNDDIQWYLNERPKKITRSSFFESAVFAIWVSGLKRKSVVSFLERAEKDGFSWDYKKVATLSNKNWESFKQKLHDEPISKIVHGKWDSIKRISKELSNFENEKKFREQWFSKKILSSKLNNQDIDNLEKMKFGYIGPANSHFIIRNMGGEAIKCDRWIEAFLNHYKISQEQLIKKVKMKKIPIGLFDLVIWAYCEKHVNKVKYFSSHFDKVFS